MANVHYFPLVFECLIAKENRKPLKEFLYNDHEISYETRQNVNRLKLLCIEIYSTINNRNPEFMRDLFSLRETSRLTREKYMLNLNIPVHNQVTFRSKSLRVVRPRTWNSLPYHINPPKILSRPKW